MPDYRVYLLGNDRRFRDVREIACPDDAAAIAHARRLIDGCAAELWQEARLIAQLPGASDEPLDRAGSPA
jgi:hypothetical protein